MRTFAVAASTPDGGVAIHQMVRDTAPSSVEVEASLARAGVIYTGFVLIDVASLPSREHRAAWVLRGGKVEIDPARIAAPVAPEPRPDLLKMIADLQMQVEYIARNTVSSVEVVK